ncbi:hypothetical protein [Apilactobacillus xinyiensis]|uniref:hypothetical protein n=1 Tax=Apilactobacillus xinyiensis TaxID=2841032 RepID=UPI001C7D5FC8|nr:hypothetical protein [Apilactobacillus xinyiensis]MCL0329772.1 hypothetical protein [Apilactobacillus xinyiensis]
MKNITKIILFFTCTATLLISNQHNIKANRKTTWPVEHIYVDKAVTHRLQQEGYAYRIGSSARDDLKIFGQKNGYNKQIAQKIVKNKIDFKVKKVWVYSGATGSESIELVSKNNKYHVSVDYIIDYYHKDTKIKALKPLIQQELKMLDKNERGKLNQNDFNKLNKITNQIKNPNDRQIAEKSVQQLQAFVKNNKYDIPSILIGQGFY